MIKTSKFSYKNKAYHLFGSLFFDSIDNGFVKKSTYKSIGYLKNSTEKNFFLSTSLFLDIYV